MKTFKSIKHLEVEENDVTRLSNIYTQIYTGQGNKRLLNGVLEYNVW